MLIVIAIIGIVAMLALPSLIASYKDKATVAQMQKGMNTWENVMKMMMARDGVSVLAKTDFLSQDSGGYGYINASSNSGSTAAMNNASEILKKYLKISQIKDQGYSFPGVMGIYGSTNFSGYPYVELYLPDGMIIYVCFYLPSSTERNNPDFLFYPPVLIDVNGDKKPNVTGRDVFVFFQKNDGSLVPHGSKQYADMNGGNGYWKNDWDCGDPTPGGSTQGQAGRSCAARIIENGWKIDYK